MATEPWPSTSKSDGAYVLGGHNDFICGWCAAFIETFTTYPLSKIAFRQQVHGVLAREAASQLHMEGVRYFYRGLLPPLLQKTSNRAVMFGIYDKCKSFSGIAHQKKFSTTHAMCAMVAGSMEALMCPFERVQVLLQSQAYHDHFRNTFHAARELFPHGVTEFYRGLSIILLRNGPSNVLFFGLRTPLKDAFQNQASKYSDDKEFVSIAADFGSGAGLGCALSTLFFPLNVVKSRMQSKLGGSFENPLRVFAVLWNERNRSVQEFYRGWSVNFYRSFLTWGITNMIFELLHKHVFTSEDDD